MRIPRSRGAVSGLLLVVLGAWGAVVPFVGSYFSWVIGSDQTWDWTAGRFWLSVLPGAVAIIGGLWLMRSAHRASAAWGTWMAIAAGAWFVVGSEVSRLWNHGVIQAGPALGGNTRQVFEQLTYFSALGTAIVALAAFALGRLTVRRAGDVELAHDAHLGHSPRANGDSVDRSREGTTTGTRRVRGRRRFARRRAPEEDPAATTNTVTGENPTITPTDRPTRP